jgi:hypothetical protein
MSVTDNLSTFDEIRRRVISELVDLEQRLSRRPLTRRQRIRRRIAGLVRLRR